MHSKNIIHWDIKPENILVSYWGEVKLSDFGWSVNNPDDLKPWHTRCGTLDYFATEMLTNKEGYTKEIDIWSIGVLAYELSCKRAPFAG